MLELVIFDVDGLMIDTESVWKEAFDKAGDKYDIPDFSLLVDKHKINHCCFFLSVKYMLELVIFDVDGL